MIENIINKNGLKLNKEDEEEDDICEGCIFGAMKRSPFKASNNRATEVGELIHTDVGFVNVSSNF